MIAGDSDDVFNKDRAVKIPTVISRSLLVTIVLGLGLGLSPMSVSQAQPQTQPQAENPGAGGDPRAVTLLADVQEANAQTGIMTATGNVQIFYPLKGITATAIQAQYFSRERRMVLTGNVVINQTGGNSIHGERVTYLLDEERFIVAPKASEQVRSVYVIPEEEEKAEPAPAGIPDLPSESTPDPSDRLIETLPRSAN